MRVTFLRIKTGCYPIAMDVPVEPATPFRFEGSGSYLSLKLVIISALLWARFFKF